MAALGRNRVALALRTCCLLLCLVAGTRQITITEFMVPEAVEAGTDAVLQCRYSFDANDSGKVQFVKWFWTPDPAAGRDRIQIYQRAAAAGIAPVPMHHNVEVKENDTIVLKNMQPSDSGIYQCEVIETVLREIGKHENLIVFTKGTGPQLNITTVADGDDEDDDEDVLIECEAEQVAPLPALDVYVNNEDINVTEVVKVANGSLYDVYAYVTLSKKDVNGAEVRCQLYYVNPNISHPLFEVSEVFSSSGAASLPTTDIPKDTSEAEATPHPLQNMRDNGNRLQGAWVLLIAVTLLLTKLPVL